MLPENIDDRYELLAKKWLNGTITPEEAQEYASRYMSNQERPLNIPEAFAASRGEHHDRILNKLHKNMNGTVITHPAAHRVHFMRRRGYRAAAAILLLLMAGGAYLVLHKPAIPVNIASTTIQKDLIRPGGNKALLTLAGGQTIVLDSAAKGTLAQQGSAHVTKLADGLLSYTADNSAPAAMVYNTLSTPRGGQYRLSLPDGTAVWLNAASSITYPTAFAATERNVSVSGEAYFEVAKDKTRPFHVQANNTIVTVLGTHFNINAYSNEAAIKTTLLEGSVEVNRGAARRQIKPGQQAQVIDGQPVINVLDDVNTGQVVAWKDGFFDFQKADLATVLRQLERWYDIQVQYKGGLPPFAFVGKLQRSLSLPQVLRALKENEINYTMEGRTLVITP